MLFIVVSLVCPRRSMLGICTESTNKIELRNQANPLRACLSCVVGMSNIVFSDSTSPVLMILTSQQGRWEPVKIFKLHESTLSPDCRVWINSMPLTGTALFAGTYTLQASCGSVRDTSWCACQDPAMGPVMCRDPKPWCEDKMHAFAKSSVHSRTPISWIKLLPRPKRPHTDCRFAKVQRSIAKLKILDRHAIHTILKSYV